MISGKHIIKIKRIKDSKKSVKTDKSIGEKLETCRQIMDSPGQPSEFWRQTRRGVSKEKVLTQQLENTLHKGQDPCEQGKTQDVGYGPHSMAEVEISKATLHVLRF